MADGLKGGSSAHAVAPMLAAGLVAAMVAGLPLEWAVLGVTAAPAFVIVVIDCGQLKQPELFPVR